MIKVRIHYTEDEEMIEAHCMADEIGHNTGYDVEVIDKDGNVDRKVM